VDPWGAVVTRPVIRPLRWWDVESVVPVERELFGDTAWSPEVFWAELAQTRTRWYVVAEDEDGTLLGYAGLLHNGAEGDVQTIAVAPAARRRGIGALLLRTLLAEAVRCGCTSMMLEVRADNAAAIALYESFGFERISVRRGYYQPGAVDAWVMRLRPLPREAAPDGARDAAGVVAAGPGGAGVAGEPRTGAVASDGPHPNG
jgi:ribosomal-protein-alanine N-acetyltransferase